MSENHTLQIRPAKSEDAPLILEMIRCLAEYEKRPQDVTASEEDLLYWLFERNLAEVLIAECEEKPVAYALYYPVFNSFSGEGALYIEDIVVKKECRGSGFGGRLMRRIAALAEERGYKGVTWGCLDWNTAAMGFYESLGAKRCLSGVHFEFDGDAVRKLAREYKEGK
ncbi:GNAT family N-acetyltransferase [Ruminococcaceae bacterium OttesenSCG-928-I18]|nr:GNAT family N-acetyltransferase [Ruminococcaceae bacterium OttesenSCG-928-I18]